MVVAAPIVSLLISSFREGSFFNPGNFTLSNYKTVYFNPQTYPTLINTVIYAFVPSIFSLLMRVGYVWGLK
jgi:ABC-type spermidine/putrescine transport system permease subunit II